MPIRDSSALAEALQLEAHRAMSGEQRLLMALEMSLFARELTKQRIRTEHPEWSDMQIAGELIRLAFLPGLPPAALR